MITDIKIGLTLLANHTRRIRPRPGHFVRQPPVFDLYEQCSNPFAILFPGGSVEKGIGNASRVRIPVGHLLLSKRS
jgi:hypothetical protein